MLKKNFSYFYNHVFFLNIIKNIYAQNLAYRFSKNEINKSLTFKNRINVINYIIKDFINKKNEFI